MERRCCCADRCHTARASGNDHDVTSRAPRTSPSVSAVRFYGSFSWIVARTIEWIRVNHLLPLNEP
ncbi:hypothetical protein WI26_17485 [Burkholderia diffusa]|nr:hypothetical protein WI26_17485 [Burkholderia diffusa]